MNKNEAVIISAVRTPVGRARGKLASIYPEKLGAYVMEEAVNRAMLKKADIEEVIFGNLFGYDVACMGRVAALEADFPIDMPALTIDRQCSSSLDAIAQASIYIKAGYEDIILVGGVESDSNRPYLMSKPIMAYQSRPPILKVVGKASTEKIGDPSMGITAENIAEKYSISRESCDLFAWQSHQKAIKASDKGLFKDQILPVNVFKKRGEYYQVSEDETIRRDTTLEILAKMKPIFKDEGIVTAGNSCPMSDGAGALVIASRGKADKLGLNYEFRIRNSAAVGLDPNYMGLGPVYAIKKLLKKENLTLSEIDLIEINEAFAAQILACIDLLDIDVTKLNVNGGAIALGHPLGGTGAVIATKMVYEMKRRNVGLGLIAFCCGGGQGAALLIEKMK